MGSSEDVCVGRGAAGSSRLTLSAVSVLPKLTVQYLVDLDEYAHPYMTLYIDSNSEVLLPYY